MIHKIDQLKFRIFLVIAIQIAIIVLLKVLFDRGIFTAGLILIIEIILLYYSFFILKNEQEKYRIFINNSI